MTSWIRWSCWMLVVGVGCSDDGVPATSDDASGTAGATASDTDEAASEGGETDDSMGGPSGSTTDGPPGTTGSSGSGSGSTTSGSSGTGTDTDTDTDASSSGSDTGSSSSTGGGGEGDLEFEWDAVAYWQNCQPIVAMDPVIVQTSIVVQNMTDMTANASVVSARFIDDADMTAITFDLDTTETGDIDPKSEVTMMFNKSSDSSMPANFCNTLTCNANYRIEIVFEDGLGQETLVSGEESLSCPV